MLKLTDLKTRLGEVNLKLGGAAVTGTLLSFLDEQRLEELCPQPPIKSWMPDPGKGSNAPPVPDTGTSEYRTASLVRRGRLTLLRVAAVVNYTTQSGDSWQLSRADPAKLKAWATAVETELGAAISEAELAVAIEAIAAAEVELIPRAAKN